MNIKQVVGDNIRMLRYAMDYTLDDLSIITAMSRSYLNEVEHGNHALSVVKLEVIAKALRVDAVVLITSDGWKLSKEEIGK